MFTTDPERGFLADRRVWGGCAAWGLFAVLAVVLRGVRWEETWEHALLITRAVPLPEGHPMFTYVRNVFSLQSYLSAALLYATESPLILCGLRNVLQLVSTTVPVFLWGALLTQQTRWGHAAALLVLAAVHKPLESYYPIVPWPHFYATGQIGLGCALFVLFLLAAGYWRAAWCGLALLAGIHLGQLPPLLLLFGAAGIYCLYMRRFDRVVQAAAAFAAGLLPILFFYLVLRQTHVAPPDSGPYAVEGNARAIYQAYSALHDLHRTVPRLNDFIYSVLAWGLLASMLLFRATHPAGERQQRVPFVFLLCYLAAIVPFIAVAGLFQLLAPEHTPFLVTGWMPFRLMNHVAVLFVPVAVAMLAGRLGEDAPWSRAVLLAIVSFAALQPAMKGFIPSLIFDRYIGAQELFLFLLLGAAFAAAWFPRPPRYAAGFAVSALFFAVAALAGRHHFGLFLFIVGALAVVLPRLLQWRDSRIHSAPSLTVAACFLLAGSLLVQQYQDRSHLPIAPIQRDTMQLLSERGDEKAMLLVPYWDIEWLGKTRHPIFADYQTAHLMSYMPRLAPVLKTMHSDVYGWTLDEAQSDAPLAAWPARSPEAWTDLANRYGFRYVLSPVEIPLTLPRLLETHPYALYAVPDGEPAQ